MEKKTFYRVGSKYNEQGLWYTPEGEFTGSIHDKYNFCTNNSLTMPFDPELVGWLSATPDLEELFHWFTLEDILKLQEHGFHIAVYEASDYREYVHENYTHMVINQKTSRFSHFIHEDTVKAWSEQPK